MSTTSLGEEERRIADRVLRDIESDWVLYQERMARRNLNFDFLNRRQWTADEIAAHERQKRYPYVFNEIRRIMNHVIGMQVQTRMDAKLIPREKGDSALTQILSHVVKWAEQVNNHELS